MEFKTKYSKCEPIYSPIGDRFVEEYGYKYDKDGKRYACVIGKKDIQAEIDSYAESCDIGNLLKRFTLGDTEALNQRKGFYIDARDMPSTYAELFQRVEDCKKVFDELPADLKSEFGNSYSEFWSSYGSAGFDQRISDYNSRFVNTQFDSVPDKELEVVGEK